MKKKESKKLIIILTMFAVIINVVGWSYILIKGNKEENVEKKSTSEVSTEAKTEDEILQSNYEEDTSLIIEESPYTKDFAYDTFPDSLLAFIDNDTEGMKKIVQERLYARGYYDYTLLKFRDEAYLDFKNSTITTYWRIEVATGELRLQLKYNWNIKNWSVEVY